MRQPSATQACLGASSQWSVGYTQAPGQFFGIHKCSRGFSRCWNVGTAAGEGSLVSAPKDPKERSSSSSLGTTPLLVTGVRLASESYFRPTNQRGSNLAKAFCSGHGRSRTLGFGRAPSRSFGSMMKTNNASLTHSSAPEGATSTRVLARPANLRRDASRTSRRESAAGQHPFSRLLGTDGPFSSARDATGELLADAELHSLQMPSP